MTPRSINPCIFTHSVAHRGKKALKETAQNTTKLHGGCGGGCVCGNLHFSSLPNQLYSPPLVLGVSI